MIGTVKRWDDARGFGFLAPAEGGRDVFVHVSAFKDGGLAEPAIGEIYEFDLGDSRDGRSRAVNLRSAR